MQANPVPPNSPIPALVVQQAAGNQAPLPALVLQQARQIGQIAYVPRDPSRAPLIAIEPPARPPVDVLAVHQAAAAAAAAGNADQPHPDYAQYAYRDALGRIHYRGIGRGRYPRKPRQPTDQPQRKRHRTGKNASTSNREREGVVSAFHDLGQTPVLISQVTHLKESTVRSVLRAFDDRGDAHKRPRGGNHKPEIDQAAKEEIIKQAEAHSQIKLRQIRDHLTAQRDQLHLNSIPSISSIQRTISKHDFTMKLTSYVPDQSKHT
jgi:transposase